MLGTINLSVKELMEVAKEADEADEQAVKEMAEAILTEKVNEREMGAPKNQKGY